MEKVQAAWTRAEQQLVQQLNDSAYAPRATPAEFFEYEAADTYSASRNVANIEPLDLPREHIPNTPDFLSRDSYLYTTFGALTGLEVATKIAVNDASQVASVVDKLEQVIDFLSEAIDPPTKFRQFLAELKSVSSGCVDKLARTCAYNALFAQYCKRYSLCDGAPREQKRQVLARPYGDAKDALGGLEPPKTTPKKTQSETPQSSVRNEGFKQPPFWQPPTRQTGEIEEEASKGSKSTAPPPESSAASAEETETERESEQTSKGKPKVNFDNNRNHNDIQHFRKCSGYWRKPGSRRH